MPSWIPEKVPRVRAYPVTSLVEVRPRLMELWHERRLVLGSYGAFEEPTDFVGTMVNLARESPVLTPPDCDLKGLPDCDALFSGAKTANGQDLRFALQKTFGTSFLRDHEYDAEATEEENRRSLQVLLSALKTNYTFYYGTCLPDQQTPGFSASCDLAAQSMLLGQVACGPEDDRDQDDCVYSDVRFCPKCGDGAPFFEYSRFHGPLRLFETKASRDGLMGQCEEFSRAAHALLSSLGYETRYVLDFTDHVWVEVRMPRGDKGQWVHADPSEGVLDNPLMYEKGWGKQLTMIFAFTPRYVEHVTHRYTADYQGTIPRRGIDDDGLNEIIKETNDRLRLELPRAEFGYQSSHGNMAGLVSSRRSGNRDLEEIALWSHFEKN